jgi:hypothetical protein
MISGLAQPLVVFIDPALIITALRQLVSGKSSISRGVP